jgi:hypothetical protein
MEETVLDFADSDLHGWIAALEKAGGHARTFGGAITIQNRDRARSLFPSTGAPASKKTQQDQTVVDLPSRAYHSVVLFK